MKRTNNVEARLGVLFFTLSALYFIAKLTPTTGLTPPQFNELLPRHQNTAQR